MSLYFVVSLLLLTTVLAEEDYYDRRYDYFNVDQFVNNPRLLKKYLDCFVDQGPCTPIGRAFKLVLADVIKTNCAKCSPAQKKFTKEAFDAFKSSLPESHATLVKKYDPNNQYYKAFEEAIAN